MFIPISITFKDNFINRGLNHNAIDNITHTLNIQMIRMKFLYVIIIVLGFLTPNPLCAQKNNEGKLADKPLFRDPVYDGAADPAIIWNQKEKEWFIFYTNRRANAKDATGVTWVHGTRIGIAESSDCFSRPR
jgi:hypothetical protein